MLQKPNGLFFFSLENGRQVDPLPVLPAYANATNAQAVKVMGAPPPAAKAALGKFYHPHNAHLKKFLEGQPHAHCSPNLAGLGIGSWAEG